MLYGATTLWFLAFVLSKQRNYQDSWTLEDVFWPFVGLVAVFLLVLAMENDNRIVALLCALTVSVVALIPALKYQQPYSTTVDSTEHYLMTKSLLTTGRVIPDHVYASIPGMHAWLASLALTAGFSAAGAVKFGLPLTGGIMPLLVYWLCRRVEMPSGLAKYTISTSCLAIYPYHLPTGTGFTLVPLIMLLGVLVLREYYCTSGGGKFAYTLVALISLAQLIFWHSTTPMMLPLILVSVSLTPAVVWLVRRSAGNLSLASSFLRVALLAAILFAGYRVIEDDQIFEVVVSTIYRLATTKETLAPVPERLFEITPVDVLQIVLVIHGRDALLVGLAALGLLVSWRYRARWQRLLYFYTYLLLICVAFGMLVAVAYGGNYRRFTWAPLAVSPFFAGPALWWLDQKLLVRILRGRWLAKSVWLLLIALLVGVSMVQFFVYQPLVPKAKALTPKTAEEYVVWLHQVNSAYQQRMLIFAETHTDPGTWFALDIAGVNQFIRYFGHQAGNRRGLDSPLHWHKPIDANVKIFLLHWPGPAGGLGEQVENRSVAKLTELRDTPGWGLVYDNGESFILQVR